MLAVSIFLVIFIIVGIVSRSHEKRHKKWTSKIPREALIAAAAAETVTAHIVEFWRKPPGTAPHAVRNPHARITAIMKNFDAGTDLPGDSKARVFVDPGTKMRYENLRVDGGLLTVEVLSDAGEAIDHRAPGAKILFRDIDVEAAFLLAGNRETVRQSTRFSVARYTTEDTGNEIVIFELVVEPRGLRVVRNYPRHIP